MKNETERMRELYDQWLTQGISKQAFCNRNDMGYHKFNYWVKKFRVKNVATTAPAMGSVRYQLQNRSYWVKTNRRWQQSLSHPEHL